jgi:transcriptional regulator of acetoin/glycerol metabolism
VRELQNVLEQIVLLCDDNIIEPAALPEDFLRRARAAASSAGNHWSSWRSRWWSRADTPNRIR